MRKILFVDSYDSYTYNVYQLILDVLPGAEIIIVRNDQYTAQDAASIVRQFDFIVIGPGPGDPRVDKDVGFLRTIFDFDVPILGVCLGFQLLCLQYGAAVECMKVVKHGQVSDLQTNVCDLYPTGNSFPVTRYHSIGVNMQGNAALDELAWVNDHGENGHVSMAVQHKTKPFVGVQYHPESACSEGGADLIQNFVRIADSWNSQRRTGTRESITTALRQQSIRPRPLVTKARTRLSRQVEWQCLDFLLSATTVAEALKVESEDKFILLDAAAEPSRYSIVASLSELDPHLHYYCGSRQWTYGGTKYTQTTDDIWHFIAQTMDNARMECGPEESPFWGGLMGYLNYESGVESISVAPLDPIVQAPDINMVFVHRSIVIDHKSSQMYVQSVKRALHESAGSDKPWIQEMVRKLEHVRTTPPASPPHLRPLVPAQIKLPGKEEYFKKIASAQALLAAGESYELCLTAPTRIDCGVQNPWRLYQSLRARNPSPFATFMKLPGINLLSSSPERFLSWSRNGLCQLRPIKGTVRKESTTTLSQASDILKVPKELAENLMIVDLIRHDLHQIASDVRVPSLMQVEEYETVFQLVSVITGQVEPPYTGFDVLSRSLPPGSMTGAPKKRSVELLQQLELSRRGLYSGVCGYLSVCGAGDWSVVIRSAFRYTSEVSESPDRETWWIGAGGAITALSDPEAEWQEMLTKLQSTLPCFDAR